MNRTNITPSALERLQQHQNWALSLWSVAGRSGIGHEPLRDLLVAMAGLQGECGELAQKLVTPSFARSAHILEAGDVLYYLLVMLHLRDFPLIQVRHHIENLERLSVASPLGLMMACSGVSEAIKRTARTQCQQEAHLIEERKALTAFFQCYLALLERNILSLDEVMSANVEKLESRKQRGVLEGNGDNR